MSLASMIAAQRGAVPAYSALQARAHILEAWSQIRLMKGWSFQFGTTGFASPSVVSAGTATVTFGSPTVTLDATAAAALIASSNFTQLVTQRQFRVGASTIYNIIAFDPTTPLTLTLDRPWIDTAPTTPATAGNYWIYQCYYPAPTPNFQAWETVTDIQNSRGLKIRTSVGSMQELARNSPQRMIFSVPEEIIPYGPDTRPGSATLGRMLYELYPQPQATYAYSATFTWLGPDLTLPTDTVPYPITEDLVKTTARIKAYEWAEANRDPTNPRGAGADYRFLLGTAAASAAAQLKEIRLLDRDLIDAWNSRLHRNFGPAVLATYDASSGTVTSGNW